MGEKASPLFPAPYLDQHADVAPSWVLEQVSVHWLHRPFWRLYLAVGFCPMIASTMCLLTAQGVHVAVV